MLLMMPKNMRYGIPGSDVGRERVPLRGVFVHGCRNRTITPPPPSVARHRPSYKWKIPGLSD